MRPIHPGEILREEFLVPLGMGAGELAQVLKVSVQTIEGIVQENSPVTPDTALRLARYFGSTPEFWLNLQTAHDLRKARQHAATVIEREVAPRVAA
jgi:addiction module HigA family antidote